MTASTTKNKGKRLLFSLIACLFWLGVWELASLAVGKELLLPSPRRTAVRLYTLAGTSSFWISAGTSLLRIAVGFLSGVAAGTLFAVLTAASRFLDSLLSPLGTVVRATPVASFILLALVWIQASNVPSFISFLMVTPIVWSALKTAILNTDRQLLEAAKVYRLGRLKTVRAVFLPSVLPTYTASLLTSLGLAWKSGIAAEVLCHPRQSIGIELYESKIYLETADLFAWTATVVLLSVGMEALFALLLKRTLAKGERA